MNKISKSRWTDSVQIRNESANKKVWTKIRTETTTVSSLLQSTWKQWKQNFAGV